MVIELTNVQFHYSNHAKQALLSIPHWSLSEGERVLIHGDSGSGKSTLLGLLSGILVPTAGTVTLFGARLDQMSARQRDRFRAEHIGYVYQQFNLIPYLNAFDNITLASRFAKRVAHSRLSDDIKSLLNRLNVPEEAWYRPSRQLSIGQQQRVAIARALINKPPLLIADEPTSSLDAANRDDFMTLLSALMAETGMMLVMVSHDQLLSRYFERIESINHLNQREFR